MCHVIICMHAGTLAVLIICLCADCEPHVHIMYIFKSNYDQLCIIQCILISAAVVASPASMCKVFPQVQKLYLIMIINQQYTQHERTSNQTSEGCLEPISVVDLWARAIYIYIHLYFAMATALLHAPLAELRHEPSFLARSLPIQHVMHVHRIPFIQRRSLAPYIQLLDRSRLALESLLCLDLHPILPQYAQGACTHAHTIGLAARRHSYTHLSMQTCTRMV